MGKMHSLRTHKNKMDQLRASLTPEQKRQANNARCKAQRAARKERLRAECEQRTQEWQALTPAEQLQRLDWRLGKGVGAQKQRKRIAEQLKKK